MHNYIYILYKYILMCTSIRSQGSYTQSTNVNIYFLLYINRHRTVLISQGDLPHSQLCTLGKTSCGGGSSSGRSSSSGGSNSSSGSSSSEGEFSALRRI